MHKLARLTPMGRRRMVRRLEAGERLRDVADAIDLSTTTVRRWWTRYQAEGEAGLQDRSSRPHRSPAGKRTVLTLGPEIDDVAFVLPGGTNVLAFGKDITQCPKADRAPFPTGPMSAYAVDRVTGASKKTADAISNEAMYCFDLGSVGNQHGLELAEIHGSSATFETVDGGGSTHAIGSIPTATLTHLRNVTARGTRLAYADSAGADAVAICVITRPGTAPAHLVDLPASASLSWSPDGGKLAAAYADKGHGDRGTVRVFDVAADGSHTESKAPLDLGVAISFALHSTWLPDASAVLVQLQDLGAHNTRVVLRPVDPARLPMRLSADLTHLSTLIYEPGGESALYTVLYPARGSSVWTANFVPVKQP